MTDEEKKQKWLEARHRGLGGSDAAVVMGQAKKTPFALFLEKTALAEDRDLDDLEFVQWGHILEDPVAKETARRLGFDIYDPGRFAIVFSEEYEWMHCTIDREIVAPHDRRGSGSLSIKCAGEYRARDWTEGPPLWAQIQLQHELVVRRWSWGVIAVLVGGNKLRHFEVEKNERFCSLLVEREEEFWDRVRRGSAPPVDSSDTTAEILRRMYPVDSGETVTLPYDAYAWIDRRAAAKEAIKLAEQEVRLYENKLRYVLGDASCGLLPARPIGEDRRLLMPATRTAIDATPENLVGVTLKRQKRASYTVPEVEFRTLREERSTKLLGRRT